MMVVAILTTVHILTQRFSTCGPRITGGARTSAWWSASKALKKEKSEQEIFVGRARSKKRWSSRNFVEEMNVTLKSL